MKGCCSKSFNFTPTTSSPLPPLFTNSPISLSKQTTINPFEPSQQNLLEHSLHKHPSQLRNPASAKTRLTIGSSRIDKTKCFRNDAVPPCWLCWYAWKLSGCHRWFACDRLMAAMSEFDTRASSSSLPPPPPLDDGSRSSDTPTERWWSRNKGWGAVEEEEKIWMWCGDARRRRKSWWFFKPYEAILPQLIRNRGILSYYMPRLAIDPKHKGPYCLGYKRTEAYSISELKQKKIQPSN